ncbi:MAG TPA: hypothetical protein VN519_10235 [Bryobacteraceae bacterium]|nr:hypothetical protein [Bryobacteraceae bacterium]
MSADAELHIVPPQRRQFTVAQARLNREQEKRPVAPSNPRIESGGGYQSQALCLSQKGYRASFMPLRRNRQHALAMKSKGRFVDRYVPEEGVQRGEAVVSRTRSVSTILFKIVEKLPQKRRIEIFQPQF